MYTCCLMNGLLTIYKKQDFASSSLKLLLEKGLDSLSHRGDKARASFLMNQNLQSAKQADVSSRLAMGACSQKNNSAYSPCIASGEGNILFFEGRLLNKKELCGSLSITTPDNMTDADVVFRMMKQNGVNCFRSLKGFWSLIYLDAANETLYGARDHFGNRPLWFCNTGNHFALASESRTLYSLFEDVRSINRNTVVDYLLWGNIGQADQFFFNEIHSIEPSHFVKYEMATGRLMTERYYTLPYNLTTRRYNVDYDKHYVKGLLDCFTNALKMNLSLFDGALAVGVSGGKDSSSLLCLSKKIYPDRTFVAYTATDNYDGGETDWAEKVVRHTEVEWIKVTSKAGHILEQLDALNRVHSAPVFNTSSLAQYRIMEEVKKQGHSVFIDGQGGDELLGGYPAFFPFHLQVLRKNDEWGRWLTELMQAGNSGMTLKETLIRRLKLWAKTHYYTPEKIARKKRKNEYESLNPEVREAYFANAMSIPFIDKKVLNDALYESYTLFLGNIMRWGEHSAASQGVECVMPFANYPELTECAFDIPSSYKIHNGWNKYLLRQAMAGIVPDEIRYRKQKMGFYVPEQKWLNDIKKPLIASLQGLKDPEECIHKDYIMENLNRLYTPKNPLYQQFIFRCYSYLLWRNNLI